MCVKDLVLKNRSYRGYDESFRFTKEDLLELIDLTRYTASTINSQPLCYVPVWEPEKVAKIQAQTVWARALPEAHLPHEGHRPTAFIVICLDKRIDENRQKYQRDVGIVAQTILLALAEKGLGGCMIGNYSGVGVKAALQLDECYAPLLVLALGKPDEKIVLTEIEAGGSTRYYRDENNVHYVPKRKLKDIVIL